MRIDGSKAWEIRISSAGQIYTIEDASRRQGIGSLPQTPGGQFGDQVWQFDFGSYAATNTYIWSRRGNQGDDLSEYLLKHFT